MQSFGFRSYGLIVASSEADLVCDVRLDTDEARLHCIQGQLRAVVE